MRKFVGTTISMLHDYNVILETKAEEVKILGEKYMAMKPYIFFYGSDPVVM